MREDIYKLNLQWDQDDERTNLSLNLENGAMGSWDPLTADLKSLVVMDEICNAKDKEIQEIL